MEQFGIHSRPVTLDTRIVEGLVRELTRQYTLPEEEVVELLQRAYKGEDFSQDTPGNTSEESDLEEVEARIMVTPFQYNGVEYLVDNNDILYLEETPLGGESILVIVGKRTRGGSVHLV